MNSGLNRCPGRTGPWPWGRPVTVNMFLFCQKGTSKNFKARFLCGKTSMHFETSRIIIGGGAQCKYAMDIFSRTGKTVEAILDPIGKMVGKSMDGIPITPFDMEELCLQLKQARRKVIVCLSDNRQKKEIFCSLEPIADFAGAIHPACVISDRAKLAGGVMINAGAVVQPYARVGKGVMIHAGVIVEHDNHIGDFVNLAPGVTLAGGVRVGECATIFSGAVIAPNVSIGADSVVGAGSLVLDDLPDKVVAFGSPASIAGVRK